MTSDADVLAHSNDQGVFVVSQAGHSQKSNSQTGVYLHREFHCRNALLMRWLDNGGATVHNHKRNKQDLEQHRRTDINCLHMN